MSKNDDDPMKKILERRQFIENEKDNEREVEDDDPLPDISDSIEQRAARPKLVRNRPKFHNFVENKSANPLKQAVLT